MHDYGRPAQLEDRCLANVQPKVAKTLLQRSPALPRSTCWRSSWSAWAGSTKTSTGCWQSDTATGHFATTCKLWGIDHHRVCNRSIAESMGQVQGTWCPLRIPSDGQIKVHLDQLIVACALETRITFEPSCSWLLSTSCISAESCHARSFAFLLLIVRRVYQDQMYLCSVACSHFVSIWRPVCSFACLLTCLLAFLLAHLLSYPLTYMLTYLIPSSLDSVSVSCTSFLPSFLPFSLPSFLPSFFVPSFYRCVLCAFLFCYLSFLLSLFIFLFIFCCYLSFFLCSLLPSSIPCFLASLACVHAS